MPRRGAENAETQEGEGHAKVRHALHPLSGLSDTCTCTDDKAINLHVYVINHARKILWIGWIGVCEFLCLLMTQTRHYLDWLAGYW